MTFEQFVKRTANIPSAARSALFQAQSREYERYRWQEEMSRWKAEHLGRWTYDEDEDERHSEFAWEKSNPYVGKRASFLYTDEMHLSDLDLMVFAAETDGVREAPMSFDDAMGFGGTDGR